MATKFDNVIVADLNENGQYDKTKEFSAQIDMSRQGDSVVLCIYKGEEKVKSVIVTKEAEYCRLGKQAFIVTSEDQESTLFKFDSIHNVKSFQFKLKELKQGLSSIFTDRTDEASAVQYFQFYGYLSQQQNMMQDYIRTSTYQRAMLSNINDFLDKVVLDVGAGSGILSFFALQAGARKVYAIEASNMAEYCEQLVRHNKLQDKIIVIPGKVEEVSLPEKVDTIISEPMGYMLFNERMLESFLHAKKWLKPKTGKMYPTQGDLHVAPFTDEALYMEQFSKANFWYQESFHGINLTSLRDAAVEEYFKQPIVDTFDIRMCLAKSLKHTVDFLTADETDLHVIEIPLNFTIHQTGLVHGLAFWFDVAFLGTVTPVWLSTSPTETLTHWYQVRCLVQTPVLVKQGQSLTGKCLLRCNKRQSYDVDIELNIPGTTSISKNSLDLKNPFFRYTGQTPAAQPGTQTQSPSDAYWNTLMTGQNYNTIGALNGGMMNGVIGDTNTLQLQAGAPINPGSIPSVLNLAVNSSANRTSIGGGISPINFSNTQPQNVITGTYSQYPISSQFMIGDYVTPGNLVPLSEQNKS
ncbi:histone-arginine methyltransferase CARMER-like isoform X2 [Ruditapes philippinarum]|uniref:histone-arginine methyltransferase CARMER-like isoform X2 n=1 Tax=Ruditapes philippinarum TaxID=129788 RepID=UPI00295AD548|nr:histone-arginine methyltransferase CARMER-like isoform X2 [Ruditapes philippinarum]